MVKTRLRLVLLCFFCTASIHAYSQVNLSQEQLKAVLTLKIPNYITWETYNQTFNIAYYGSKSDSAYKLLDSYRQQTKIHQLSIDLVSVSEQQLLKQPFNVLVVPSPKNSELFKLNSLLMGRSVLVITDNNGSQNEVMVNLISQENGAVSFEINRSNILLEKLEIDNEVLLLGGTELDIALLLRENESKLNQVRTELLTKENEISTKRQLLEEKETKLSAVNQQFTQAMKQLKQREDAVGNKQAELDQLLSVMKANQQELERAKQQLNQKQNQLDQQRKKLNQQEATIKKNIQVLQRQEKSIEAGREELASKSQTIDSQKELLSTTYIILLFMLMATLFFLVVNRIRSASNKQLKIAIDEAQEAKQAADEASLAKTKFLATMSHEIRTPMSGVIGMSDLLAETDLNTKQQAYNNAIRSSGETLLSVINDILDFSKIEAGKMTLEAIEIDINELLFDVTNIFRVDASKKQINLAYQIYPNTSKKMVGDPVRIRQILFNLINNALKFTHQGEIIITVLPFNEKCLQFKVQDTGIGINDKVKEQLFSAFSQADSSTTRKYGGTGLGLSICRRLVELMDGAIAVESDQGQGSSFAFTIPLKLAGDQSVFNEEPLELSESIAYIGHSSLYNDLQIRQLCEKGFKVSSFDSIPDFLQMIKSDKHDQPQFDLIVLEATQPEDLTQLTVLTYYCKDIHTDIFLLDKYSLNRIEEFEDADPLIISNEKPINGYELIQEVSSILGLLDTIEPQSRQQKESDIEILTEIRILVAEDNPVVRQVIKGMMKQCDQEPDFAETGRQALEAVKQAEQAYDLVLMDCEMPEMDGLAATKAIRAWEKEQNKPPTMIIALTAHVLEDNMHTCLEAGMNNVMTKPLALNALRQLIISAGNKELLELKFNKNVMTSFGT